MKDYAKNDLPEECIGILFTFDENGSLIRCHTTANLKGLMLKFEKWDNEKYFECYDSYYSDDNMKVLKFFKQNSKRLFMEKYGHTSTPVSDT